jgi:ubiquinone/menaquinone biosynthesis C-methylase UbiE
MTAGDDRDPPGYLHGYSADERDRLRRQARFLEPMIHDRLPFRRRRKLLEVGAGVGAQTEILLRHFPELHITGIEINEEQIAEARRFLATVPWATGRHEILKMNATRLEFEPETFDAAFLCWVLEHVGDPARVLGEVRRVLTPGAPIVCNEVQNATFFLDPYSPNTLRYWMAFNDHQLSIGGDPFVGAKLGNLLQSVGFRDIQTDVRTFHLDNRAPAERAEFIAYWADLLRSGAPGLLEAKAVSEEVVNGMTAELTRVARDPNAVFFYSFIQARARVW